MFHQGTLQSGITLAIQEQKLVACFVRGTLRCAVIIQVASLLTNRTDDSATSREWQDEWLKSAWVRWYTDLHSTHVLIANT
jgi:hypothetical protein